MAWALLLLVLLTYCSGSNSQPTLTQPSSASVSPGTTVKLSCTVSSSMNTIAWHQQRPGQAPHYLLYGTSRGDGVPDRFTGSTSGNVGYLTITNAQAEDDADYYCAMWGGGAAR
uniref:Ig-like domain-containing protein n=1 Tax=Pelusios castaneus TaxID=367368 RepID=A0A8C8SAA2_9SAUR